MRQLKIEKVNTENIKAIMQARIDRKISNLVNDFKFSNFKFLAL